MTTEKECSGCSADTPIDSLHHGEMYSITGDYCENCVLEYHRQLDAMVANHQEIVRSKP